jgi:hypothetical protein
MVAQVPVYEWIRSLQQEKREPLIIELEQVPLEQAAVAEDKWIAYYRASGAKVLNRRNGATGALSRPIHQQPIHHGSGHSYRGVTERGKKWLAIMRHKGIYQNLGTYATAEEAAQAYDRAAIALFGAAALLNFPLERED